MRLVDVGAHSVAQRQKADVLAPEMSEVVKAIRREWSRRREALRR